MDLCYKKVSANICLSIFAMVFSIVETGVTVKQHNERNAFF